LRGTFVRTLIELAARDERVLLLTGDLGYLVIEPFAERFPRRFFNIGVAEQDMVGIATGLAEAGFIPFVYSIATFASLRPYEFVRNGPVYHRLPVRIVGIGGGFEYGVDGFTHHAIDDLGAFRLQPGIAVFAPADALQARAVLEATWDQPGPIYYRLGKDDKTVVEGLEGRFAPGRVELIGDGGDLLLLATGAIATEAEKAVKRLAEHGVQATLGVAACLSPPPDEDLARLLARFPLTMTVEAHNAVGGLGSLVCEVVADNGLSCRVIRCGVRGVGDGRTGSQAWYEQRYGLSAAALVETALGSLRRAG